VSWRLWAKALGEKAGKNEKEADVVAFIRTIILFSYIATNAFIVAGVIRHWNDVEYSQSFKEKCITTTSFR
jgi:hypothetical protein